MVSERQGPRFNFVVWPPLPATHPEGIVACASAMSWFVAPIAEAIQIPVRGAAGLPPIDPPDYISTASMIDADKVHVVPEAVVHERVARGGVVLLVRDREAAGDPILARAWPRTGSQRLPGTARSPEDPSSASYFYVGNPSADKQDAYHLATMTYWLLGGEDAEQLQQARDRLLSIRREAESFARVAVFGTGPSLAEALDRDHSDSLNVICNTIVKNRELCKRLQPRIVVASDAHFHFSHHRYSARFLADLCDFLQFGDSTFFTFDKFAAFVRRRLPDFADRVFGLPVGRTEYGFDFDVDLRLFPGDSVLNMFLLPIASFLGRTVSLNGFTGRSASDAYFWSHSDQHQYTDLLPCVRAAHPAFFKDRDYGGYADTVDREIALRVDYARRQGKVVRSETTSFYSSFAK